MELAVGLQRRSDPNQDRPPTGRLRFPRRHQRMLAGTTSGHRLRAEIHSESYRFTGRHVRSTQGLHRPSLGRHLFRIPHHATAHLLQL